MASSQCEPTASTMCHAPKPIRPHAASRRPRSFDPQSRACLPQAPQTPDGDKVHGGVEPAIGGDLPAQVAFEGAQQMVPLQDLMQQDAVEEAGQGEAE